LDGGGTDLSAGKRKGLKDPLMAERRFLIGLLVFTSGGWLFLFERRLILRHKISYASHERGFIPRFETKK